MLCFLKDGGREVGTLGPGQQSFFFVLRQIPKAITRKKKKKKSFCLAFCCSGHKQQSGIKGVVGAPDLISTRFSSHKHPSAVLAQDIFPFVRLYGFRWNGLLHCSPWTQLPFLTLQAWNFSTHSCLRYLDPRQSLTWWLNII